MSRRHRLLVIALVVVLIPAGILWEITRRSTAAPAAEPGRAGAGRGDRTIPVRVAPVRQGPMAVTVDALGTVTARNTAVVRARVDGLLLRVPFREGDTAKVGQLLAEIDPKPFEVAVEQARGQLARDQAQLDNARIDLTRYRGLLKQDSIAKQQVDDQEALVRQLQGTVQLDRALLDNAQLQLSYTRVTAPIAGRLGLRQVDAGNQVRTSDTNGIVTITETQPIDVVFAVPADRLPTILDRLRSGATLTADAYDREGKTLLASGRLASVDNQIDPTTGTIKIKAEFANQDQRLFPNQFVNVRLVVDTLADATLIPAAALQRGAPGIFVYVVQNGGEGVKPQVTLRVVTPGPGDGDAVTIAQGLQPGEQVVIDGADKLRDGMAVEVAADRPVAGAGDSTRADPSRPARAGGGHRRHAAENAAQPAP